MEDQLYPFMTPERVAAAQELLKETLIDVLADVRTKARKGAYKDDQDLFRDCAFRLGDKFDKMENSQAKLDSLIVMGCKHVAAESLKLILTVEYDHAESNV